MFYIGKYELVLTYMTYSKCYENIGLWCIVQDYELNFARR